MYIFPHGFGFIYQDSSFEFPEFLLFQKTVLCNSCENESASSIKNIFFVPDFKIELRFCIIVATILL